MDHTFHLLNHRCFRCGVTREEAMDDPMVARCIGWPATDRATKVYCLPEDLETAKRLIGAADVPLSERGFGV